MTTVKREAKKQDSTQLLADIVDKRISQLDEYLKNPEAHKPVLTPLKDLNKILHGGFPKHDAFYTVILGRDKIGKSTLGKHLFLAYCERAGKKGIIFDLEESIWDTADRALAMRSTTVNRTDIYKIEYTKEQLEYLRDIASDIRQQEIYVNDQIYNFSLMLEDAIARGIKDILIDNYQLMLGGSGDDIRERLEFNSKSIMRARNQYGLTTWLCAQGNEQDYTAGSKQPFKDANYVLEIRGKYEYIGKKKGNMLQGIREVAVTRARKAGTGSFSVVFDAPYSRVRDVEDKPEAPVEENFMTFEAPEEYEQAGLFDEEEIENGTDRN